MRQQIKQCFRATSHLFLLSGIAILSFSVPVVVFAQGDLQGAIEAIGQVVDLATPIAVGLALLFFFWGVAIYILNAGNEDKKSQGRTIMLWGVIALFVIFSIFGLVRVLQNTFVQDNPNSLPVPTLRGGRG